jgi:hypothetical protein
MIVTVLLGLLIWTALSVLPFVGIYLARRRADAARLPPLPSGSREDVRS